MSGKAMTLAKLKVAARVAISRAANVVEQRASNGHVYVVVIPGQGEVMRARTLLDLYKQVQRADHKLELPGGERPKRSLLIART
jgi:hypothetical protein